MSENTIAENMTVTRLIGLVNQKENLNLDINPDNWEIVSVEVDHAEVDDLSDPQLRNTKVALRYIGGEETDPELTVTARYNRLNIERLFENRSKQFVWDGSLISNNLYLVSERIGINVAVEDIVDGPYSLEEPTVSLEMQATSLTFTGTVLLELTNGTVTPSDPDNLATWFYRPGSDIGNSWTDLADKGATFDDQTGAMTMDFGGSWSSYNRSIFAAATGYGDRPEGQSIVGGQTHFTAQADWVIDAVGWDTYTEEAYLTIWYELNGENFLIHQSKMGQKANEEIVGATSGTADISYTFPTDVDLSYNSAEGRFDNDMTVYVSVSREVWNPSVKPTDVPSMAYGRVASITLTPFARIQA